MLDSAQFTLTAKRRAPLDSEEESRLVDALRPLASFTFAELCSGERWMPWFRFPPEYPSHGFVLVLERDLPLENKVAFSTNSYRLLEIATSIRRIIDNAEWLVRVIDLDVHWDATNELYRFENVALPEPLLQHWQSAARERELRQIKQSLVEEIDLATAENLIRESVGPDILIHIFGSTAESETKHAIANFRRFAAQAFDSDNWWTYDAAAYGEGSGVALVRADDVVDYLQLESEY